VLDVQQSIRLPLRLHGTTPADVAAWLLHLDDGDILLWVNDRLVRTRGEEKAVEAWFRLAALFRRRSFALLVGAALSGADLIEDHVFPLIAYAG
jgi:hypothetical protein